MDYVIIWKDLRGRVLDVNVLRGAAGNKLSLISRREDKGKREFCEKECPKYCKCRTVRKRRGMKRKQREGRTRGVN